MAQSHSKMLGTVARPIAVLVVDDSVVARAALARMVEAADALTLTGVAVSAEDAIARLQTVTVDVILLDLEMPGLGGLRALPELLAASRGAHVLVVSSAAASGAAATLEALRLGAADTLLKPSAGSLNQSFGAILADRVGRLGIARVDRPKFTAYPLQPVSTTPVAMLAIGASTGGIRALADFFAQLPASFAAPIAVTQHLPPAFIPSFVQQIAAMSGRTCGVPAEGEPLQRNHVAIARGDAHLMVTAGANGPAWTLSTHVSISRCCPSVDPMLASAAQLLGPGVAGVVLTGMGRDGLEGAAAVVAAGGSIVVQDEASSTVWGMPGSIARAGHASVVASPPRLAAHIGMRGSA